MRARRAILRKTRQIGWRRRVPLLPITDAVTAIVNLLIAEKVMPGPLAGDVIHAAVCVYYNIDYLLSWNVRHLANPNKRVHLAAVCASIGRTVPLILTPDVLWQ